MDDGEMGNTRVPRVSTQGKLKTHKCKHPQCGFVAVTKLDFWEHTKTHIKAEKLLTCPHCPFVTEYKHHLEYHTRNHLNSKPFKCPKCSYSCVNKSMLNSHMKSHSNVYQVETNSIKSIGK
jgi:hunchback-like protein